MYRQTSNISDILAANKIGDHSDAVGASPVSTCSNHIFILDLTTGFNGLGKNNCKMREGTLSFGIWCVLY